MTSLEYASEIGKLSLTVVAEFVFVQDTAPTLVYYICNPYTTDGEAMLLALL
jgi:hypothetical protein